MKKKVNTEEKSLEGRMLKFHLTLIFQNFNQLNILSICNMLISGKRFL